MRKLLILLFVLLTAFVAIAEPLTNLELLIDNLSDTNAQVRAKACYDLGKLGDKSSSVAVKIGYLMVNDKSPAVRQMAAQSIGDIALQTRNSPSLDAATLVGLLIKALRDPLAEVRCMAAQAIGNFMQNADPATKTLAFLATSDGDKNVRKAAVSSLGTIGHFNGPESKKAIPYLAQALSDPDPEIIRLTTYVLSRFGDASLPTLPKLIETLRDGPPEAQKDSARTIGTLGPSAISAVPLLFEKVKQERHLRLREEAAKAIIKIDPTKIKPIVDILEEGTRSKDSGIRMFAFRALLSVDMKRIYAGPTLKRLQNDEIVEIQLIVSEALKDVQLHEDIKDKKKVMKKGNEQPLDDPKVTIQDATQDDADAALTMLRTFLDMWQNKKYSEAEALVDERLRLAWRKLMKQRPMQLRSINKIRINKDSGILYARANISINPKGDLSLDLIFKNEKWWISGN